MKNDEKKNEDKLIFLLPKDVSERLDEIFDRLAVDKELRSRFTNDPIGVMKEFGGEIPDEVDISLLNRVIFHLMADEDFIAWSHDYTKELREQYGKTIPIDKKTSEAIAGNVEKSISRHLPPNLRQEYDNAGGFAALSVVVLVIALVGAAVFVSVHVLLASNFAVGVNVYFQENLWTDTHFWASASFPFGGAGTRITGGKAWGGPDG